MNIAIVEDMHVDAEILRAQLLAYASQKRLRMDIHCFSSAEELLAEYHPLKYTVVFLDIFMNGMNGVEAARTHPDGFPYDLICNLSAIFLITSISRCFCVSKNEKAWFRN